MLSVHLSNDKNYARSVLARPGIYSKVIPQNGEPVSVDEALARPGLVLFEVIDGDSKLGFVVLDPFDGVYLIHTCLLTLGSRSRRAIELVLRMAKGIGIKEVLAVFDPNNKAVLSMSKSLGFVDYPGYEYSPGYVGTIKHL